MIGFYVLYLIVFVYLYGGTKYAYYRKGTADPVPGIGHFDCQCGHVCADYYSIRRFPVPIVWPMLLASAVDFVVIVILNQISDRMFHRLFPPKSFW